MEHLSRQKKFQQTLNDQKLDGFVMTHAANLRYLCGYTGSNGLLLFLGGGRVFFTDGRYTEQAAEEVKGARVVIARGPLMSEAAKVLAKTRSAAIGFEADLTTVAAAAQMKKVVHRGIRWKATAGLVMRQRMIKDADELKLIRQAVNLGAKVYEEAAKAIRPGVSEVEVAGQTGVRGASRGRGRHVVRYHRGGGEARRAAARARRRGS